MEEERRLCYVGMTRAQEAPLSSVGRATGGRFGGAQPEACLPSRFLNEVPPKLARRLSPYREPHTDEVELLAEQYDVRESVKRNSIHRPDLQFCRKHRAILFRARDASAVGLYTQASERTARRGHSTIAVQDCQFKPTGGNRPLDRCPSLRRLAHAGTIGVRAGATIHHPKYGRGMVLRREGDGEDAKLTISFPGYGLKKIVEKYAGIKVDE